LLKAYQETCHSYQEIGFPIFRLIYISDLNKTVYRISRQQIVAFLPVSVFDIFSILKP
jgi:hypothetical protein